MYEKCSDQCLAEEVMFNASYHPVDVGQSFSRLGRHWELGAVDILGPDYFFAMGEGFSNAL